MESIIEMDKLRKKLKLVKNSYYPKAKFKYKMSSIDKAISKPIKKVKLPKILPSKNFTKCISKITSTYKEKKYLREKNLFRITRSSKQ